MVPVQAEGDNLPHPIIKRGTSPVLKYTRTNRLDRRGGVQLLAHSVTSTCLRLRLVC
jgi:hypothetical protein